MNALGGISEWPQHVDCFPDAHPFLKYTEKKIQVQTSCLRLVRWTLKARQFVLGRELGVGWAVCVYCLSVAFSELPRGFASVACSQIQLSAVFRCCGWYGNLFCVF